MTCELSSGCKNDIYGNFKYCVLHCSHKDIESKDMDDYLKKFSEIFMKYLYESILYNKFYIVGKDKNVTPVYGIDEFKYKNIIDNKLLIEKLSTMDIIIKNIVFPESSDLENHMLDARTIIKYLGKVNFESCKFGHLIFNGIKNYYHKYCTFAGDVEIYPFPQVITKDNKESIEYRYVDCIFEGNVTLTRSIFTDEIYCNMFYDCFFNENIIVNNLKFKKTLLKFPDILQVIENKKLIDIGFDGKKEFDRIKYCYKIKNLSITDCNFESEFKLNGISKEYYQRIKNAGYEIENNIFHVCNISLIDNKFKSKVEVKYRTVEKFIFNNSNVGKVFDTFQSRFIEAKFSKNIFNDFAGFEEVDFGVTGSEDDKENKSFLTVFEHVTFLDFSSFRGANFRSGLDFSKTNLKDKPNFLGVYVDCKNTKRETFRIIKNSFDDAGNNIEENKFFVEEMKAYRKELKANGGSWFERFILFCNRWISNFGSSYIMPIGWLIVSILIFSEIIEWHSSFFNETENTYFWHSNFDYISIKANNFAKNFLPFSRFLTGKSGIEFVSLLFYIWFAVLIWQTIVAVKRHTQR